MSEQWTYKNGLGETGSGRYAWLQPDGGFVGMTGFGASAPIEDLYEHFGITAQAVVEAVKARL